ncbi:hypothetical protein Q5P01_002873 [Channa striata]|uniref:Uncharacterized protein n=1 Tax=Channa striata TaxID=64152 RepID=A0AA88NRV3_CHASR|nr:hypothetical protein Q5P01_002873 [Channa striata]
MQSVTQCVCSDRDPAFHLVVRLAQRLVEVGRRRCIHDSEAEEIVVHWENLREVNKDPVKEKESFNKRYNRWTLRLERNFLGQFICSVQSLLQPLLLPPPPAPPLQPPPLQQLTSVLQAPPL